MAIPAELSQVARTLTYTSTGGAKVGIGTTVEISGVNIQRIGSWLIGNNVVVEVSYSKDGSVFQGTDTATINSLYIS